MVIMKYQTIMFNDSLFISHCIKYTRIRFFTLSQYSRKLCKSVSIRKTKLKFGTVTSTKDTHIPKTHISVAESLRKIYKIYLQKYILRGVRGESHVDFRTHCFMMTQITSRPQPLVFCYLHYFQILDKIVSFLENVLKRKS